MDAFGIGNAVKGAAEVLFMSARRTGRTTALLEALKDGDRVVCPNEASARHMRHELKKWRKKVAVFVVPVNEPNKLFSQPSSDGRTVFDHVWVEDYYRAQIAEAAKDIDHWQAQSSGFGAAHVETRHRAEEIHKWNLTNF
jgi:hypothetical protein